MCPLFRGSTVHKEEDSLSIVDEIQCVLYSEVPLYVLLLYVCMYVCVCMCVYVHVCMYVCVYVCI